MQKKIIAVVFGLLFLVHGGTASAAAIYNIIMDATGSISKSDFKEANVGIHGFIYDLYRRALAHPGETSDWISVNYFGGPDEYQGTKFINCSSTLEMIQLQEFLEKMGNNHPQFGNTAIYNALAAGTLELMLHDRALPFQYLKVVMLVTDGEDNSSQSEVKAQIRGMFPNEEVLLLVVGQGAGGKTAAAAFNNVANLVATINDFSELKAALLAVQEIIE